MPFFEHDTSNFMLTFVEVATFSGDTSSFLSFIQGIVGIVYPVLITSIEGLDLVLFLNRLNW